LIEVSDLPTGVDQEDPLRKMIQNFGIIQSQEFQKRGKVVVFIITHQMGEGGHGSPPVDGRPVIFGTLPKGVAKAQRRDQEIEKSPAIAKLR
jgi:hypothetical protein